MHLPTVKVCQLCQSKNYIQILVLICSRNPIFLSTIFLALPWNLQVVHICAFSRADLRKKQRNAGRSEPMLYMADSHMSAPGPSRASEHCVRPGHQL